MERLEGKTALITGASRGIGLAIAQAYALEGATLILSATDENRLDGVAQSLRREGVDVHCVAADLAEQVQVEGLFQQALVVSPSIDILVNNAGIYDGKPFEEYALADLDRLMQVNVYAVFTLMQRAVTHMKARGSGKIVNISSTAGKWESMNQAAYNTTKHAVVGLSKCVALETGAFGINVNTICPGMVETDMFQNFDVHAKAANVSLDELKESMYSRIPMQRFMQPEEIAHLAVYLGSRESDGMTGQTLTISGGMRMG